MVDYHKLVHDYIQKSGWEVRLRDLSLYLQAKGEINSKQAAGIIVGFTHRSENPFLLEIGGEGDDKLFILNPKYEHFEKEKKMPENPEEDTFDLVSRLIEKKGEKGTIKYLSLKSLMVQAGHNSQGVPVSLRHLDESGKIIKYENVAGEWMVRLGKQTPPSHTKADTAVTSVNRSPAFDWARRIIPIQRISITANSRVVNANLQGTSTDLANVFALTTIQNGSRYSQVLGAPIKVTISLNCPDENHLGCFPGPLKMVFTPKEGEAIIVNGEERSKFELVLEKGEAAYLTSEYFDELPSNIPSVEVLIDGGILKLPVSAMFVTQSSKFSLRDAFRILLPTSKDIVYMGDGPEDSYIRPNNEPLYLWFYVPASYVPEVFMSQVDRLAKVNLHEGEKEAVLFCATLHPGEHIVILPSYTESI